MEAPLAIPAAGPPIAPGWSREILAALTAVLVGVGAVGSLVALSLLSLGVRRFVLVDPKRYRRESVTSQCEPEEVGQHKVLAVARRLRHGGHR